MKIPGWTLVIGLETHLQLKTKSKLFSSSSTDFGQAPNHSTNEIDFGLPGVLPSLNEQSVKLGAQFGYAINGKVQNRMQFERKHYFYPDLPKGYQITQFQDPIVSEGHLDIDSEDGTTKTIRIERAHLEEDAGKSIHFEQSNFTGIDLNRAGCTLLEIVTYPDLRSSADAVAYLKKLHAIAVWLDISDGEMSEGSMRVDANVSVMRDNETVFGDRVEIKNINSFRFIAKAIDYEYQRQVDSIERGIAINQETRLYNSDTGLTKPMRSKEDAKDYRYFPDPDLVPVSIDDAMLAEIKANLPLLPQQVNQQLREVHGLSDYEADVIAGSRALAEYSLEAFKQSKDIKQTCNWILGDFSALLQEHKVSPKDSQIPASSLADLVNLVVDAKISGKAAKDVLLSMWKEQLEPLAIVEREGLQQISDDSAVLGFVQQVLADHPEQAQDYRDGKTRVIGFLVGKVMAASKGKANPKLVNELIAKELS